MSKMKYFRMTFVFAFVVFIIMCATMVLTFCGANLLAHFGIIEGGRFDRFPLMAFCIASIIVGTVIAFVFGDKPLRPLRDIMDAVDKIADGDYSARVNLKGTEELRQLSDKFNHMASELGSVEMLRSDFVSNFSHEFKTPIVSIRGFAKALKWDDLTPPPEEKDEYLDIIISESERLSELSANVLYLSKIEKQSILTDKKKFNVSEQIRLVVALLDKKLSEKKIDVIFESKEYFVVGNEEMLKQVWINLLDNAIKFSPEGSSIEIRIRSFADTAVIKIADHGKGISPEAKTHIFDKFYQCDLSHSTSGNGLGLAIVKKIIDLHGGSISVNSSDKGSTFGITLNNK